MTDLIDTGDSGKPVVGIVYYDTGDAPADPTDGNVIIVCHDCDGPNAAPAKYGRAELHDKPCYGRAIPHMFCDDCGKKLTGGP